MKNAILFGNGMNLVGGNSFSWEDLLKSLSPRGEMPSSSNTLSYECIYLSRCSEDSCEAKEGLVNELTIKKQIAAKCQQFESNDIYELMMSMPTDVFITTNYDDVLGKTFEANEYVRDRQHDSVAESIYSIRRCHAYREQKTGKIKKIFPIHGECMAPKTIMIGYDHYCGSLGKLDDYFKGKYVFKSGEETKKLRRLLERLRDDSKNMSVDMLGNYWPDYFFTHDIHMIGIGMPLVESDLWWVLNKRSRYKKVCPEICNSIYFYATQTNDPKKNDSEINQLLETFDVKVVLTDVLNEDWHSAYEQMFEKMKKNMDNSVKIIREY